jgi:predicted dehydrogenase
MPRPTSNHGAVGLRPREEESINETSARAVISVGVVGLGRIGAQLGSDHVAACANYSQAARTSQTTSLSLGVDPDADQRGLFEARHGAPALESVEEAKLQGFMPDLWIVACPAPHLVRVASDLLRRYPNSHLLVEKPLAVSERDLESCRKWPARRVRVGYTRRFIVESSQIREVIESGRLGRLRSVRCVYSRGFANNASHLINLLQFLAGEVALDSWTRQNAWSPVGDCAVDVVGRIISRHAPLQEAELLMTCVDEPTSTVAAMDLDFELGRVTYEDLGASVTIFPDQGEKTELKTDLSSALCTVIEQLALWVSGKEARGCTLEEALDTSNLLKRVVEQ